MPLYDRPEYVPGSGPMMQRPTLQPHDDGRPFYIAEEIIYEELPLYVVESRENRHFRQGVRREDVLLWVTPRAYETFESLQADKRAKERRFKEEGEKQRPRDPKTKRTERKARLNRDQERAAHQRSELNDCEAERLAEQQLQDDARRYRGTPTTPPDSAVRRGPYRQGTAEEEKKSHSSHRETGGGKRKGPSLSAPQKANEFIFVPEPEKDTEHRLGPKHDQADEPQSRGTGRQLSDAEGEGDAEDDEDDQTWPIRGILDDKMKKMKGVLTQCFLIDWQGDYEPSWEPEENIDGGTVDAYWEERHRAAQEDR